MAMTVSASIQLVDMMTGPIQSINNVLNTMLAGLASVDTATDAAFNATQITSMQNELAEVDVQLAQIVEQTNKEKQAQDAVNASASEGLTIFEGLKGKVMAVAGAYLGMQGVRKTIDFVKESMSLYDTQLNSENQLASVLANMLDADYVAQFEVSADTTAAVDEINAIQGSVDDVTVTVNARTTALETAFDDITAKASEIQSQGIYGDEAMIAGAAEFATYFSDPEAITTMMDTLADYAMGMTGGGEIDATSMVDYATNLGKIMSGSYDAMTKKGFEFTDVQKEIIEGTASAAEIAATLGEEYVGMSEDMQAAATITQIIDEAWAGLYETMSDTPQGKIIQLTNAFGDMREVVGKELYPYIVRIVDTINANWGTIQSIINGFATGLKVILSVVELVIDKICDVADFVQDNWDIIKPILTGIAVGWAAIKLATMIATVAQWAYNAALYACPIVWIIGLIAVWIVAMYYLSEALGKYFGIAETGFGTLCGTINVVKQFFVYLGQSIVNVLSGIWEVIKTFLRNMERSFKNSVMNIKATFFSFGSAVMEMIANIAEKLNELPFMLKKIDTSWLRNKADEWATSASENKGFRYTYASLADAYKIGSSKYDAFPKNWYVDAMLEGTAWGDKKINELMSMLGLNRSGDDEFDPNKYNDLLNGFDPNDLLDSSDETAKNTKEIAKKTSDLADLVKDNREKEAIAKYTSNTPVITYDLSGMTNTYHNTNDAFDMVKELGRYLNQKHSTSAEGV